MMRMVGTMVDIIFNIVDEKMIVNMPRYIFLILIRPEDDFGVESLSHFVSSFLTKKNITWHVNDHFLINR